MDKRVILWFYTNNYAPFVTNFIIHKINLFPILIWKIRCELHCKGTTMIVLKKKNTHFGGVWAHPVVIVTKISHDRSMYMYVAAVANLLQG